jgi:predicted negative regulator of RcsB-dependent stress response
MAKHLDLEEQEQLDQLKAFWAQYGNMISWVLIVVFGSIAAYNGWQFWQRKQATDAAVLYDTLEQAAKKPDLQVLERSLADMQDKFSGTTYANQAGLLAAQVLFEKGDATKAMAALQGVANKPVDDGYAALARLRMAGLHLDAKAFDLALKALEGSVPKSFDALFADRKGDVFAAQNKRDEAIAEWKKAYTALDETLEYRRMLEIKLNSFGVDPAVVKPVAAASAALATVAAAATSASAAASK